MPTLLSAVNISVNNLSIKVDVQGDVELQTGGVWKGNIAELTELIAEACTEIANIVSDGKD